MRIILMVILLLFPLLVNATNYYIAPLTASPAGNDANLGTIESPWYSVNKAAEVMIAGDILYIRGGIYYYTSDVVLSAWIPVNAESGTELNPITYTNYQSEVPIFDFKYSAPDGSNNAGFAVFNLEYIVFKGFIIRNVAQINAGVQAFGFGVNGGANLTFNRITVHDIAGQGFVYYGGKITDPQYEVLGWDKDSTSFINCDAYSLMDTLIIGGGSAGGLADGYKLGNYAGGVFYINGCRAWNCSDDAWDISGNAVQYTYNSWAFANGQQLAGWNRTGGGEGFKYGFNDVYVDGLNSVFKNCISAYNRTNGFHDNCNGDYYYEESNLFNNLAIGNSSGFGVSKQGILGTVKDLVYRNNISFLNTDAIYSQFGSAALIYVESNNTWDGAYDWPCWSPATDITITAADFVSDLDSITAVTQLSQARKADGSLPDITFGRLSGSSDLIGAGTDVGMSATPDIGVDWAYYDITYGAGGSEPPVGNTTATIYSNNANPIKSINATVGGNITSDGGAAITARGIVWGTSANPTLSNNVISTTGTTGGYSLTITGLSGGTTYHVRSYATNSVGTAYGAEVSFTTPKFTPLGNGSNGYYFQGKVIVME